MQLSLDMPALGATLTADGHCTFCVWAPKAEKVSVVITSPVERIIPMQRNAEGYHTVEVERITAGTQYWFELDGHLRRPDPASRFQPYGVHNVSEVVDSTFGWTDGNWRGVPLESYIFYELHIGTFTSEGTFDAVIPHLHELVRLGITAIEIMPIAQFPGARNWGYDGVGMYAAQNSYGGVGGLKRLVNACHELGLAVVLDVVYNHLGPEGNYLNDFGYYFTQRYRNPWGNALNFDGAHSDAVRRYFIENALYWVGECHIDGLRLDATQEMADLSAHTVLEELVATVHQYGETVNRKIHLIAETDRSDDRLLRSPDVGGLGMDAQWSDEMHHVLHALLTGEEFAYYKGFRQFSHLVSALRQGYVHAGQFSPVHERRHGSFRPDLPAKRFVICLQNHDHVGNRAKGDRLNQMVSFEALKFGAGVVLLSPYLPMIFMGEEYAADTPFLFFTNFGDPALREAVRKGRAESFAAFNMEGMGADPESEDTFQACKLNHSERHQGHHAVLLAFYAELIRLRKSIPALSHLNKAQMEVIGFERQGVLFMRRWHNRSEVCVLFNLNETPATIIPPIPKGRWTCILASGDSRWQKDSGEGTEYEQAVLDEYAPIEWSLAGLSFVVFVKG